MKRRIPLLITIILPIVLFAFILLIAIEVKKQVEEAVVAILSIERAGDFEQYTKSKQPVAAEIIRLRSKFQTAIQDAIDEYNNSAEYPITELDGRDQSLNCWMIGICASATNNWTKNTDGNIMGVPGLDSCSPEKSIEAAAKLIISLYVELCLQGYEATTISTAEFMSDYYLTKEQYYDPEISPLFDYGYDESGMQFGYPDLTGKTYMVENPGEEQKDLETARISSQKMWMFTACYFYGNTDIMKFWSYVYSDPIRYNSAREYVDPDTGFRHCYWDDAILSDYDYAFAHKQDLDNEKKKQELRQAALIGDPMDIEAYASYEDPPIFHLDPELVSRVYRFYDAYNVLVNTGQKIGMPVSAEYEYLIDYYQLTDFMGYRWASWVTYDDGTQGWSSGKRYTPYPRDESGTPVPTNPHCGIDIGLGEGKDLIACITGIISEAYYSNGEGYVISITSLDNAYTFRYLHCQMDSCLYQVGEKVQIGELIGKCGSTGPVTGPHLHFEIVDNSDGKNIDPLFILTNGQQKCDYGENKDYKLEGTACKIIDSVPEWFSEKRYETSSEENVYLFLREYGFNSAVSCGIMSCLWGESHFDTGAVEELEGGKSGPGFGIAQWSYGRRVNLLNWLEENGYEPDSFEGQMWFLMYELETTEAYAYSMIKDLPDTSSGAYQAGFNFALYFERSGRGEIAADEAGIRARDTFYPKYQFYDESDTSTADNSTATQTDEVTPDLFADSLFIGDSRVNRLFNEDMLSKATRFAKDGIGNTGLVSASLYVDGVGTVTLEELLQSQNYKKIYIANGINQMWAGANGNFKAFEEVYEIVRRNAPEADIYIQSVIPTSYTRMLQYPDYFDKSIVNDYNQQLKNLCEEKSRTYFIDIASLYVDSTGYFNTAYTSDGLHQNYDCQYLWVNELVKNTRNNRQTKKQKE